MEDAVQQTFIKLAKGAKKVRGNVAAWLYAAANTTSLDMIRAGATRRKYEGKMADQIRRKPEKEGVVGEVVWEEMCQVIDEVVGELDEKDQAVIVGRFFEGRKQVDLAKEAGISEPAMKRRVDRAVERLRQKLKARGVTASVGVLMAFGAAELQGAVVPLALTATLTKVGLGAVGLSVGMGGAAGTITSGGLIMAAVTKTQMGIAAAGVGRVDGGWWQCGGDQ